MGAGEAQLGGSGLGVGWCCRLQLCSWSPLPGQGPAAKPPWPSARRNHPQDESAGAQRLGAFAGGPIAAVGAGR